MKGHKHMKAPALGTANNNASLSSLWNSSLTHTHTQKDTLTPAIMSHILVPSKKHTKKKKHWKTNNPPIRQPCICLVSSATFVLDRR